MTEKSAVTFVGYYDDMYNTVDYYPPSYSKKIISVADSNNTFTTMEESKLDDHLKEQVGESSLSETGQKAKTDEEYLNEIREKLKNATAPTSEIKHKPVYDWRLLDDLTPPTPEKPKRSNRITKKAEYYNPFGDPTPSIKSSYTIDECLNCYNELQKKELSEPIFIGGAVGLYLQGVIKRDTFHDLDLVCLKIPELDDDMEDYKERRDYYKVKDKKSLPKSIIFDGVLIDMFTDNLISKQVVNYKGKEYIVQDYHQILNAKLRMCLESFKDFEDVMGKYINISIK